MKNFFLLFVAFLGLVTIKVSAEETVRQEIKETGSDLKRGTNKAVREVKDETCELVNGKMDCAAKKAKHSVQNGIENAEDAID